MELDSLKKIWQEQESPVTPQLQQMIGKKSNSPVAKMKRNLILELVAVLIAFGGVIVFYLIKFSGKYISVPVLYGTMIILFFVYFYFKYRLLNEIECMSCQVKSNLSKQVNTLESYVRLYLWAGTAGVPVFLFSFSFLSFPIPHKAIISLCFLLNQFQ